MSPALLGNIWRLRSAEMAKTIPIVEGGIVVADQTDAPFIHIDTPAWFAWLEASTTTRFSYALFNRSRGYIDGFMTVRKERRQRGTAYWTVYRRQAGAPGARLRKVYVGPSTALTAARLEQIAAQLRPRDGPRQTHTSLSSRRSCRQSIVEVVERNLGSTIIREATRAQI